ncbi:MAG TPA: sugar transferase [Acidobacteriota bacterium]|nr:sugar transferase [Acidobacteriota bacterium]
MGIDTGRVLFSSGALAYPQTAAWSLKAQRAVLLAILVISDGLTLGLAFLMSFWFRFDLRWTVAPDVVPNPDFYPTLALILIPIWILVFRAFNLYNPHLILGGVGEYARVFHACTTGTMLVIVATFVEPRFIVSRFWVIFTWILSSLLIIVTRFCWRRAVYAIRGRGYLLIPAVIVGTNQEAQALAADLANWRASGIRVVGFVAGANGSQDGAPLGGPLLGSVDSIDSVKDLLQQNEVEELIVAVTAVSREQLMAICEAVNPLRGVHLQLSSGLYELLTTGVTVRTLGTVPLVTVNKIRLEPQQLFVKTVLEYSLAIVLLIALLPMMAVIALLIKLTSPGPILHRRRVLGVSGRPFDAFKFRTMRVDGDRIIAQNPDLLRELKENHKLKNDPRVTKVGAWLRKYSLDELPQLFNVLLGQMSLVGPRMITTEEVEKYGQHRMNLLTVKPGITGLWQVSGRSDLSYRQRVRLDMYYIRNYSIWLDLQILLVQTLPAVVKRRGAY